MILIRIADADAASMDGQFLAEYDPARPGLSPDGEELIAHIAVAREPWRALRFANAYEAFHCYGRSHGMRADGEPNRPLTAFSIELVGLECQRRWKAAKT